MRAFHRLMAATTLAGAVAFASPALADPVVDGVRDAEYGAIDSSVTYLPGAPTSNFATPTAFSDTANYNISLTSGADSIFGFLQADRVTGLQFANLYFGRPEGGFSLGFEIGTNGVNAFFPNNGSKVTLDPSLYSTAFTSDGLAIEFSLANSLFLGPISGINYSSAQTFPTSGGNVRLNLSQSFGYSVAGGAAAYGADRLGVTAVGTAAPVGAVPEPATWSMMLMGFGAVGFAMRYRRRKTAVSFA